MAAPSQKTQCQNVVVVRSEESESGWDVDVGGGSGGGRLTLVRIYDKMYRTIGGVVPLGSKIRRGRDEHATLARPLSDTNNVEEVNTY